MNMILKNVYVEDVVTGMNMHGEVIWIEGKIMALAESCDFTLVKWSGDFREVFLKISSECLSPELRDLELKNDTFLPSEESFLMQREVRCTWKPSLDVLKRK